jgi:hypothetical protein
LIGRIGLLRLLAQNHAVIRTVERARRALEAERGALGKAKPWCNDQHRHHQASCADTGLHGSNLSASYEAAMTNSAEWVDAPEKRALVLRLRRFICERNGARRNPDEMATAQRHGAARPIVAL